jgi:hypothetical protein
MSDEELQSGYAEVLRGRSADRQSCPAPEQIRALVELQGLEPERLATLDHVMSCPGCRADFDLMQAVAAGKTATTRRYVVPLAAAATVALLFSGTILFVALRGRQDQGDTLRGNVPPLQLLSPKGEVGSRPIGFVWHAAPDAVRYTLEVFTPAGDPVYTTTITDTAVSLPANVPLTAGKVYHWWVTVQTAGGGESRSPVENFQP